jgi:hypothetical protein
MRKIVVAATTVVALGLGTAIPARAQPFFIDVGGGGWWGGPGLSVGVGWGGPYWNSYAYVPRYSYAPRYYGWNGYYDNGYSDGWAYAPWARVNAYDDGPRYRSRRYVSGRYRDNWNWGSNVDVGFSFGAPYAYADDWRFRRARNWDRSYVRIGAGGRRGNRDWSWNW